jgi:hypothetical protein
MRGAGHKHGYGPQIYQPPAPRPAKRGIGLFAWDFPASRGRFGRGYGGGLPRLAQARPPRDPQKP